MKHYDSGWKFTEDSLAGLQGDVLHGCLTLPSGPLLTRTTHLAPAPQHVIHLPETKNCVESDNKDVRGGVKNWELRRRKCLQATSDNKTRWRESMIRSAP